MNAEPLFLTRLLVPHEVALGLRPPIRDSYDWHQRTWQCFEGIIPPDPNKGRLPRGTRPDSQPKRPPDFLSRVDRTDEGWRLFIVRGMSRCVRIGVRLAPGISPNRSLRRSFNIPFIGFNSWPTP